MIEEWEVTKILRRVQVLETRKVYTYNKLDSINSKPVLQRGSENLTEYNIFLPLHINFCNPRKVIESIKECASEGISVDWVYNKKFMGQFLIDSVEEKITKQMQDVIIYAEITFNLLENPIDYNFEEQTEINPDLSQVEQYSENSNKFKDFAQKVKDSIGENLQNAVATSVMSENISDAAKEVFASVSQGVISDITGGNITNIYNTIENYKNILEGNTTLQTSDLKELLYSIEALPNVIINSALRGKVA